MEQQPKTSQQGFCSICNVACQTPDVYQQHVQGKRHQALVSRLQHSNERNERSLYVTSGKKEEFGKLSELALSDYFNTVGQVSRVKFFKERGFAFVEFAEKSSVDKALTTANHCIQIGNFRCSIFARLCYHSTPQQLQKADTAHRKRLQDTEQQFRTLKTSALPSYGEKLALNVETGSDLAAQLVLLASEVGLTDDSIQTANHVAHRVESVVNKLAKQKKICRAALFGSSISTLGLLSSDVDLVLLFDVENLLPSNLVKLYCVEDGNNKGQKSEDEDEFEGNVPPGKQQRLLSNLDYHTRNLATKSPKGKVKHIAAILRCYQEFSCILTINARIPIVRCLHVPTSTQIDVSVDSLLSINNSHLLKFYSLYDHRIKPMILAVRYWAKIQEICPAPHFLTSYALTWLVLYFLQTRNPSVCPTVAELASVARKAGEPEVIISTWNATYPLDLAKWPMTQNTDSLNELFPKFFDFYANFSFGESAIILRDASITPVQSLVAQAEASATASKKKSSSKVEEKSKQEGKQVETKPSCAACSKVESERCCSCDNLVKQEPIVYVKGEPEPEMRDVDVAKKCEDETKKDETIGEGEDDDICVESADQEEATDIFRLSVVNVQDPIELTRNITGVVTGRNLEIIQAAFKAAAKVFHSGDMEAQQSNLLRQLLRKIEAPIVPKKAEKVIMGGEKLQQPSSKGSKTLTVAISPNSSVIHARSLDWFRRIRVPGITLRWLCSAVSAIGAVFLLRNVLLVDVIIVENKISPEVWEVVNEKLAAEMGIVSEPKKPITSDPILLPMFVPASVRSSTSSNKSVSPSASDKSIESSNSKENLLKLNCTARFPTWRNREESGTAMRRTGNCPTSDGKFEPVVNDYGMAFETQISKWIAYSKVNDQEAARYCQQPFTFTVTVFSCPSAANKNQDEIRFELTTETSSAVTSNIFSSIGSLISKRFTEAISSM